MKEKSGRIWFICLIVFFVVVVLCVLWFFLHAYFVQPEIFLNGPDVITVTIGEEYVEPGATAVLENKDISDRIIIDNQVDVNTVGDYEVKYFVTNDRGKKKTIVVRIVKVRDDVKPIITLKGDSTCKLQYGYSFEDPGYKATDNYDGDISEKVRVSSDIDSTKFGTYKVYYSVTDSSENTTTVVRTVKVVDTVGPVITLNGGKNFQIRLGDLYSDPGFTAIDNYDGDVGSSVKITGSVNSEIADYYNVKYTVTDSNGNSSSVIRTVQVGTRADIDKANYVAVSINEQKLWLYRGGNLKLSTNIVTGLKGVYDTPRGTFRITSRRSDTFLVGPGYRTHVDYWMHFTGDDGFHDAIWRDAFGGNIYLKNGSHGCVNMPHWAAEYLYYNAPDGILVKVY